MVGHKIELNCGHGARDTELRLDGKELIHTELEIDFNAPVRIATITFYVTSYKVDGVEKTVKPIQDRPRVELSQDECLIDGKQLLVIDDGIIPPVVHSPGSDKSPDRVRLRIYAADFTATTRAGG